ncbi:MAG: peptidylprolyl isomerase [Dehalococcoidia bacterium]
MAKSYASAPPMSINGDHRYSATLQTDKGDLRIELFPKDAPETVNNFVFLARDGFYDGVTFHRVIPGFMAQGGDPTGTGTGGPGYKFRDEQNSQKHETGSLSMANSGPNTNGSQFFICYGPQPHLNGRHTIFGKVVEGMDIVRSFAERDPSRGTTPGTKISHIEIEEQPVA